MCNLTTTTLRIMVNSFGITNTQTRHTSRVIIHSILIILQLRPTSCDQSRNIILQPAVLDFTRVFAASTDATQATPAKMNFSERETG